jgi:hypothetical protein
MSTMVQGYQLTALEHGVVVKKAAQNTPQTATGTLYTVAGGNVLVTMLAGLVTTVTPATVNTLALGTAPTTGTLEVNGIATAVSIASLEAGCWVTVQAASGLGGALVVGGHAGNVPFPTPNQFIVPPGTITWTTTGNATGQFAWYLAYVPLDVGASVS